MYPQKQPSQSAFTLLEMSIVLVIIGLLLGGVMLGQNLVRDSRLKTVVSDKELYTQAMNTFSNKYLALPGDYNKATTQWGVQHAVPATCQSTASTTKLTCDGNGNGRIADVAGTEYEYFRFWQHLANDGLIPGQFNGILAPAGGGILLAHLIGTNCPETAIAESGFSVAWLGAQSASATYYDGVYKHVLFYGRNRTDALATTPAISTDEARMLDDKYDDGKPNTGNILSYKDGSLVPDCSNDTATPIYDLTQTAQFRCTLIFKTGL